MVVSVFGRNESLQKGLFIVVTVLWAYVTMGIVALLRFVFGDSLWPVLDS
jgi:hypothetical protein